MIYTDWNKRKSIRSVIEHDIIMLFINEFVTKDFFIQDSFVRLTRTQCKHSNEKDDELFHFTLLFTLKYRMKIVYSSETFYFYLIKDVLEMIDLSQFLTEGKEEQFFNTVKSIIEKDPACEKVMSRTDVYDENKRGSAKMPRILIKENDGYEWYTLDIVDKELDIAAPKDIIGIFINRMFYPLNDKKLLMSIIDKYSSWDNYVV